MRSGCKEQRIGYSLVFAFSSLPQFTRMRLWSLCGVLLLLFFCAVPGLAISGQTLGIRRAHQPRKVDQIVRTLSSFEICHYDKFRGRHDFPQARRAKRWAECRRERTHDLPSRPPFRKWPLCPGLSRLARWSAPISFVAPSHAGPVSTSSHRLIVATRLTMLHSGRRELHNVCFGEGFSSTPSPRRRKVAVHLNISGVCFVVFLRLRPHCM